jgi:hypothetical protein
MCGSSKNKQTTKSSTKADPRAEAVYMDLLNRLKGTIDLDYDPYEGERVAGFTPQQQALLAQMTQPGGAGAPSFQGALEAAQRGAGPVTQADIDKFMNPWTDSVISSTMAGMDRGFARDVSDFKGNAITAGAFGGDRARVGEAELRAQQGERRAQMEAQLRAQGFDQATANAIAEKNLALSGSQSMLGIGQGMSSGYDSAFRAASAEQALNQARLEVPYQQYLEQRAYPYQQLQFGAGIGTAVGQGLGGTSNQTTTMPGPSPFSQIAGLGLTLAGMPQASIFGGMMGFADGGRVEEARSYEPTLRDQAADFIRDYLLGGSSSPEAERILEGLVGSRGIGETGHLNVSEFLPTGTAFSLDEAYRSEDPVSMGLNLGSAYFSAIPGMAAAKHGKRFIEDAFDRRIARDLDETYPAMPEFNPGEMDLRSRIQRMNDPPNVSEFPGIPANDVPRFMIAKAEGGSVLEEASAMAKRLREERQTQGRSRPDIAEPFDQTMIDKIAAWALGSRPSPERRRLVEGITSSTGLGETGYPGVVDAIPGISQIVNTDQAWNDIKGGDYLGALGNAAEAVLPFVAAAKGLKAIDKTRTLPNAFYKGLDPRLEINPGGGKWTPSHHDIAKNVWVREMSNPDKTVTPKTLEIALRSRFDKVHLDDPDDLAKRSADTLNDYMRDPIVRKYGLKDTPKALNRALDRLREIAPDRYLSLAPGIAYASDQLVNPEGRAEGGEVKPKTNWAGFSPEASHGIMAAGLAMMAGQSPYAAANIGAGGLAGLQSYEDYIREQQRKKIEDEKLALDQTSQASREALAREELDIRRKDFNARLQSDAETRSFRERELALRERPEFDMVKDMVTETGTPVVLNKRTGVYHDASTGEPISPETKVGPAKKKYTDLPVGVQKEVMEARDVIQSSTNAVTNLKQALAINNTAYAGPLAAERGWLKSMVEGDDGGPGTATENLDNIIKGGALENLKAIFGAAPTEGERQILLDIQGSTSKAPKVREEIYIRAIASSLAREEYNKKKVQAMVDGTYFTEEFPGTPVSYEAYLPAAKKLVGLGGETPTSGGTESFPKVGEERTFKGPDGKPVVGVWDGKEWRPK